ncbi:hypothetical protein GQ600_6162 [Phytophthora cactorum]|nr:hypothetical protein GQ600_6162 [Phytophthora cactorum]
MLSNVWAFSLAFDSSNHQSRSYLDVRVRFGITGKIQNFHLVAIPLYERHTGAYMFDVSTRFLRALVPNWRDVVIAVSSDGAANMTGKFSGLVTRIQNVCKPGILCIWCGLHQFDLVMQRVYNSAIDDDFYSTRTGLIGHLRRQQIFVAEM